MHFSPKQRTSLYLINFFKCKILLQNKKKGLSPFFKKAIRFAFPYLPFQAFTPQIATS